MSQSTPNAPTFLCYVLGGASLPRVSDVFRDAFGKTPEAVGLFAGPSDTWEGASINHVLFKRLRVSVGRLEEPVQRAAAGRPPPTFILEATSTVQQPKHVASFIKDDLMPAIADLTNGVVADLQGGLLYTGNAGRVGHRVLPWDSTADAPDPEADDWSDVL